MIAYDLDGTLCTETPFNKLDNILYKIFGESYARFRKLFEKPLYYPHTDYTIITCRNWRNRRRTLYWLNRWGYRSKNVLFASDLFQKAEIIKALGIDVYYDNSSVMRQTLKSICPNTLFKGIE